MKAFLSPSRLLVLGITLLLVVPVQAQPAALGETTFANSGSQEAQEPFLRGILLLHSFEYEDAREAFQEARKTDPDFVMAAWGEAMSHNHPVWFRQDREAARKALKRLASTPEAQLAKAPTEREKDYLRAAHVLFGEGDKKERDIKYAVAMERLAEKYPDDLDASAFYALALLGTSHGGRDFSIYMRAAAVVEEVFAQNPNHPGAAHYLIHSYDDPVHAPVGLRAARAYSKIAPSAAHALHMPSHIFVAMGMWDDVVAMNEASWEASEARVERKNLGIDQRGFHALWWLEYGYLQQGRFEEARAMLDIVEADAVTSGSSRTRAHLAYMRAAYLVDTEQWNSTAADIVIKASDLNVRAAASDMFVLGMVALHRGDRSTAQQTVQAMRGRRGSNDNKAALIMEQELEAMLLMEAGKADEAIELMQQATATEDAMSFAFGPPLPVKPSHELFGEILLDLDRPDEAQAHFQQSLARAPKRALSLAGLAEAATKAGDVETAAQAFQALDQIWHRADADLPAQQALMHLRSGAGSQ